MGNFSNILKLLYCERNKFSFLSNGTDIQFFTSLRIANSYFVNAYRLVIRTVRKFVSVGHPYHCLLIAATPLVFSAHKLFAQNSASQTGTTQTDTANIDLKYPFNDQGNMPFDNVPSGNLYMNNPSNIKTDVEYDPKTGAYNFKQTVGDSIPYRNSSNMTLEEYMNYDSKKAIRKYWHEKSSAESFGQKKGFRPQLQIESEVFDRIFGGNTIDIRPQGSAELIFGVNIAENKNPALPVKQRRISTFDFDEKIQLSVIGQIGDKMKLNTTYNTEAGFDFENQMKLAYQGHEDEIIQVIEAGNVTLPLKSSLITGSQTLFGVKTGLKFGRLDVTTVVSQQKGKKSEIEVQGGAQVQTYEVKADRYDQNRHFFLSQFFRNNYERALSQLPLIKSQANITRIEVWITNTTNAYENTRNAIAFQDLGESDTADYYNHQFVQDKNANDTLPDNSANNIYESIIVDNGDSVVRKFINAAAKLNYAPFNFQSRRDYERVELAKQLKKDQDYTFNPLLGYISLNQELNPNQVLAVAFQYTYEGKTYQVGEFSTDVPGQHALYLKMLKSSEINLTAPLWNLMMKNVYSINAYQVQKDGFRMEVWYLDGTKGVQLNYIPEGPINGKQLIKVLNLDTLNVNGDGRSDGVFDFIENVTINSKNGKIYFPVLEPFGSHLRNQFGSNSDLANKYAFDTLYKTTQAQAQVDFPSKDRFYLKGIYKSSVSSEISLGAFQIPQGSVTVTAGGRPLTENVDYTVDYMSGKVKIINQGIMESGMPIKIALESNQLFAIQSKTLFASRFDYKFSRDLMLGGTIMNLTERPITQKINIGDEPMSNTVWGIDANYKTDSRFLTKMVDKIPLISTKEKSTVTAYGEFAQLVPGHSRAVGKTGTSYLDDFEGSQSSIDIRSFTTWSLAGTPQGQPDLFPEGDTLYRDLGFSFNRAKLAWYVIDPLFFRNNNLTPSHIKNNPAIQANHFMREVYETEVFPSKQLPTGQPTNIPCFDLAFYPDERGPYNYDVDGFSPKGKFGYGLKSDGSLKNPEKRWGGIMRRIETNDFDAANIEFIQFWLLDPFNEDYKEGANSGKLYFNIGEISEDIQRDDSKIFENGLPTTESGATNFTEENTSVWGRIIPPNVQQIVTAFDNDPATREFQDVGLDGLRNKEELSFFNEAYLQKIANDPNLGTSSAAYNNASGDPSADDYHFYRGDDYDSQQSDVLQRYKKYNGMEGNSPTDEQSQKLNSGGYPTSASTMPNSEDINRDNTLNSSESYYQYQVDISPSAIFSENVGNNYITNVQPTPVPDGNGGTRMVNWYQFKIPLRSIERKAMGGISNLKSIRFMRIFLQGFSKPVYLRFARLELIRGDWRKYNNALVQSGDGEDDDHPTSFNIAAVNIEENSSRKPVNYMIPPGIQREINIATTNLQQLNEQALSLRVCGLKDGYSQAAYKNISMDVRSYKRLKMFVHAEASKNISLKDDDLAFFVRLGTDFEENYYEYELPLKVTDPGFYDPNSEDGKLAVWPESNNVDIEFDKLQEAKVMRNKEIIDGNTTISLLNEYVYPLENGKRIRIKGNPNLGTLKIIMLGIKNPKKLSGDDNDDGFEKCAEIWVNELRLTDFWENNGWAAIGRVNAKLADFANVSLSGGMSTPGYGSIDKKISDRQRETIQQWEASTSLDLGQFVPKDINLKVPMYVGQSEVISKPQYAPLDPDIPMNVYLDAFKDDSARKAAAIAARNLTQRRSINFTNVRKEKSPGKTKPHIYDVENLSLTYAYSEIYTRDINVERDLTKNYKGGLTYNYSPTAKNYAPLSKIGLLGKSKYFALIKDFNFYLLPKQLAFRTDVNRMYNERQIRNNYPGFVANSDPFINKNFLWIRAYDFKYDFSKLLKFDFQATNNALIREPDGRVDKKNDEQYDYWKKTVIDRVSKFGTTMDYRHVANASYTLPLSKIPPIDWISSTAQVNATYNWMRAPFAIEEYGHTIQNSRQIQGNATGNMTTLYNKVSYLKKVNNKFNKKQSQKTPPKTPSNKNKDAPKDTTKGKQKKPPDENKIFWYDHILKVAMGLKNVSATYLQNEGTLLAGYAPTTEVLGMDKNFKGPGLGFIFGQQNKFGNPDTLTFGEYTAKNNWLVDSGRSKLVTTPHTRTYTTNLNIRSNIEPARDLKIELTANQTKSRNNTEFFRWNTGDSAYIPESPLETGNYSISYSTWRTAFIPDKQEGDDKNVSEVFNNFLEYRQIISERLQVNNKESKDSGTHTINDGYKFGYGATSNDVLIPAFLAAYSGTSPNLQNLSPLTIFPKANWKINYTGLSKIEFLQKYFKAITLNHSYRSTFNVSGYTSELRYDVDKNDIPDRDPINNNYFPQNQIAAVTITEQFGPLLNIDLTWNNSLLTRIEFKKDRNLSLSLTNTQVTETRGNEWVGGLGYTFKSVPFPIKFGTGKRIASDVVVRADLSIRDNVTVIRKVVENINQLTAGQQVISIKTSATYSISERLQLRLFFDRIMTNPKISLTFPTANTSAGISIRFTLAS